MCLRFSNWINILRGLVITGVSGFDDAEEGLRVCSLEVVIEEAWIDQVQEELEAQDKSKKTRKILTTFVQFFLQLQQS